MSRKSRERMILLILKGRRGRERGTCVTSVADMEYLVGLCALACGVEFMAFFDFQIRRAWSLTVLSSVLDLIKLSNA